MGTCQFKLGNFQAAKACFDRALELDPSSPDARVGLAILALNARGRSSRLAAHTLLREALELDPTHPVALSALAQETLREGDYERADALAEAASQVLREDASAPGAGREAGELLGRTTVVHARARHALGDFKRATQLYTAAGSTGTSQRPQLLAFLGTSQMFLRQNHPHNAVGSLEQMLSHSPADEDVLGLLGPLYHRNPELMPRLAEHLSRLNFSKIQSVQSLEVIAEILATEDLHAAMKAINAAVRALPSDPSVPGPARCKLFNNAAVLCMRSGRLDAARAHLQSAADVAQEAGSGVAETVKVRRHGMSGTAGTAHTCPLRATHDDDDGCVMRPRDARPCCARR